MTTFLDLHESQTIGSSISLFMPGFHVYLNQILHNFIDIKHKYDLKTYDQSWSLRA